MKNLSKEFQIIWDKILIKEMASRKHKQEQRPKVTFSCGCSRPKMFLMKESKLATMREFSKDLHANAHTKKQDIKKPPLFYLRLCES